MIAALYARKSTDQHIQAALERERARMEAAVDAAGEEA
jgi:hypothetical protein